MVNMEDTIVYVLDGEQMSAETVSIESMTTFNGPGCALYRIQVEEKNQPKVQSEQRCAYQLSKY